MRPLNEVTPAAIKAWAKENPLRHGKPWTLLDGSLLFNMGLAPAMTDVLALYRAATIRRSADWTTAPVGAIHFFHTYSHPYGHAAVDVEGGGTELLTTGGGPGLTITSVTELARRFPYLGWLPGGHPTWPGPAWTWNE